MLRGSKGFFLWSCRKNDGGDGGVEWVPMGECEEVREKCLLCLGKKDKEKENKGEMAGQREWGIFWK